MSNEQLQEYESQLSEIEELLHDDPTDESLLKLKSDLVELIALTKNDISDMTHDRESIVETDSCGKDPLSSNLEVDNHPISQSTGKVDSEVASQDVKSLPTASNEEPARKKLKKLKDFEIPPHLQILDTDTEQEKNKKRRTLKTLKSKHREKQKEYESTKKQTSWQNFAKKGNKIGASSIFATQDGVHSKVGVVSGGSGMTEFQERKRHTY
jgi:survival of motor neuron-related-splicing factor 30